MLVLPKKEFIKKNTLILYFIIIMFGNTNSYTSFAASEPKILTSDNRINYSLSAGEIKTTELNLTNVGNSELQYNITYSSNLQLDNDVVGLWLFNEIKNNKINDEASNNNGTIFGGNLVGGKFGNALRLDGIDDYISVLNSPSLNVKSITYETWIKIINAGDYSPIGGVKYLSYGILYNKQGKLIPHIWANGLKWYESNVMLPLKEWNYIAMTFNSKTGELALYLNGNKIESRNEGAAPIDANSYDLLFGRAWTEKMSNYLDGEIDEIRISKIVRSPEHISRNYERAITGKGEWLQVENSVGTINPQENKLIKLNFNASILSPGTYYRELVLISNDPQTPQIFIPVTLEVLSAEHDISVINIETNETGQAGEKLNLNTSITNQGLVAEEQVEINLLIDGILTNSTIIQEIKPQETIKIPFNWTPYLAKEYEIQIQVTPTTNEKILSNNKFQTLVLISGFPNIQIKPKYIEYSVDPGETSQKIISISNHGYANLNYQLFDRSGFYEFWDDMESGAFAWTHSGIQDSWELGAPESGPDGAYSGDYCWGTDLDSNYREFTNSSLVSPEIDLSKSEQPYLLFEHWYSIDAFADKGYVEISNGTEWTTLNPEGYKGYSNGWHTESYNLTPYTGTQIRIRFRLAADEEVLDKGWFIDDVRIITPMKKEDWLTESPSTGTLTPNTSKDIIVTVNTSELDLGRHEDTIIVKSNDPSNAVIYIPVTLTVKGVDLTPPKADAGRDIIANEDEIVFFDASNSSDNFRIKYYNWTFTDQINITLYSIRPFYNFTNPGKYNVTLHITDTSGNEAQDDLIVTIKDTTKPIAIAGENTTKYVGNLIEFDGTNSVDNTKIIIYRWDFGDGTIIEGEKILHEYKKPGTYNVTLTVIDIDGNFNTDNIQAIIKPAEGSGTFLIFIYVVFIFILIGLFQHYFIKRRVK